MLDLDQYINNSIKVKLMGQEYDILEPTIGMVMQINRIEKDLNEGNMHQKRIEAAKVLMSYNKQNKIFTDRELEQIPFEGLSRVLAEISLLRLKADADPN
ncbi:MAG: hypothetical protein MSA90_22000 [Faecalicatena sp.]|uniref:hypothetical protein n=1 Tax=Faecalicatena sp. TaxID=2005360 RepID=UPI002585FAD8|nr:hypothetical protein [Faecalicatena sp.]MCI6468124.1 hypothetical protein [Faecalicatena sp.]MDY5620377.1 hypothetical protein [Lachnospiraceae bacterium]